VRIVSERSGRVAMPELCGS